MKTKRRIVDAAMLLLLPLLMACSLIGEAFHGGGNADAGTVPSASLDEPRMVEEPV